MATQPSDRFLNGWACCWSTMYATQVVSAHEICTIAPGCGGTKRKNPINAARLSISTISHHETTGRYSEWRKAMDLRKRDG